MKFEFGGVIQQQLCGRDFAKSGKTILVIIKTELKKFGLPNIFF